jgi:diguanylate cyclase (GGDEF)-like protein
VSSSQGAPSTLRRRRLLVVDDEAENLELVSRAFRQTYDVHTAADGKDGLELARRLDPDVIITDQRMPNLTGVDFLAIAEQEFPRAVRVLVTGYADYGSVVKAVNHAHVHHYVEKPFHTVDLVTVVDSLVRGRELERERDDLFSRLTRTVHDLDRANMLLAESETHLQKLVIDRTQEVTRTNDELRRANDLLRQLAVRDGLTGLFNHRYLMEHLALEVARAERYKRPFGVVFIDLDQFRRVNDRFGHAVGDQVLITAAHLVQGEGGTLRRSDFAARYGGDEFCIVLPETSVAGALVKAERIRESVEAAAWERIVPGLAEAVTVSVGVAHFPHSGANPRILLEAADSALVDARQAGGNRVCSAPDVARHEDAS